MVSASWVTTHPCNHALTVKNLNSYGVHSTPVKFAVQKFRRSWCSHQRWSNFRSYRQKIWPRFWCSNFWTARRLNFRTVKTVPCEHLIARIFNRINSSDAVWTQPWTDIFYNSFQYLTKRPQRNKRASLKRNNSNKRQKSELGKNSLEQLPRKVNKIVIVIHATKIWQGIQIHCAHILQTARAHWNVLEGLVTWSTFMTLKTYNIFVYEC